MLSQNHQPNENLILLKTISKLSNMLVFFSRHLVFQATCFQNHLNGTQICSDEFDVEKAISIKCFKQSRHTNICKIRFGRKHRKEDSVLWLCKDHFKPINRWSNHPCVMGFSVRPNIILGGGRFQEHTTIFKKQDDFFWERKNGI